MGDLASRADQYREVVERVVEEVGEHPLYELKRTLSLSSLEEKIEFVKDIQSIATSRIEDEKYLVIGADAAKRAFVPVENLNEFDEAAIRQVLAKYLVPVPQFEVFCLGTAEGIDFVLFVIPRQATRRILAKVTVPHDNELKPKVLLREGDLWTKGTGTGKRLATGEDWDEIYEEKIEREAEQRTRRRTDHMMERALAQERLRIAPGIGSLPAHLTDEEFKVAVEEICVKADTARFRLLLERLRDDAVEGWNEIGGFETNAQLMADGAAVVPELRGKIRDHKKNVFLPAMRNLTALGLLSVKNLGPTEYLGLVVDTLQEVYETSHRLKMLRDVTSQGVLSRTIEEHLSHTVPALESLISLHLIGGYILKRERFEYLRSLFRADVVPAGRSYPDEATGEVVMAFWPLLMQWGEPAELSHTGGRINLCASRVTRDPMYSKLFGSENLVRESMVRYEFCLELNSFLALGGESTPETSAYVQKHYPRTSFEFWPELIAFRLEPIGLLALRIVSDIRAAKREWLKLLFFDESFAGFLAKPGGERIILECLKRLETYRRKLSSDLGRFSLPTDWPPEIAAALKSIVP